MKSCKKNLNRTLITLWCVFLVYMGAPRCKFTEGLIDFIVSPAIPGMSCHHTNESQEAEKGGDEGHTSVASVHSVDPSSDACLCQFSQYIGVSVVRPIMKWDEYFEQKLEMTSLAQIHYISRFHSNYHPKPDTPPPKV